MSSRSTIIRSGRFLTAMSIPSLPESAVYVLEGSCLAAKSTTGSAEATQATTVDYPNVDSIWRYGVYSIAKRVGDAVKYPTHTGRPRTEESSLDTEEVGHQIRLG